MPLWQSGGMRRSWSSPARREVTLVTLLLFTLVILFHYDFSFHYSSYISGRWKYGYSTDDELDIAAERTGASAGKLTGWGGFGMNDAVTRWGPQGEKMAQTTIMRHAPGYTIFNNLYSVNGTIFIVTNDHSLFPAIRMMTSTGVPVFNSDEDVRKREPTAQDMRIISVKEARKLFGSYGSRVEGVTFLLNDPHQFISHYYHFAAELLVGLWRAYTSLDPSIQTYGRTVLPQPRRVIFPHVQEDHWRDYAKMNQYIFHGAFPSTSIEYSEDWKDRAGTSKPWIFDRVVFSDRAAAMRAPHYGDLERYAAPAFQLPGSTNFWEPLRTNVVEFAGQSRKAGAGTTHKPVITYVSRQEWGRRMLRTADHDALVKALRRIEKEHDYEVNIVAMDKLTRDEQIKLAARTTILMGIHGNGMTALLWMNPTPRSAVMEFFYPQGFQSDYEWTANAIGLNYFGWWGSERFSSDSRPVRNNPEGFQGNDIPIDGEAVAALCVHQLSLNEEADD